MKSIKPRRKPVRKSWCQKEIERIQALKPLTESSIEEESSSDES